MFYSSVAEGGNEDFKGSDEFLRLTLWLTQGFMDELSRRIEELGDIESGFVIGLHAKVLDAQVTVVIGTGQHIVPLSLRCVENVRHPELLQVWPLQRRLPATLSTLSVRLPSALKLRLLHGSRIYSLIPNVHAGPNQVKVCVRSPGAAPEQLLQV